jgi:hypothetical protein
MLDIPSPQRLMITIQVEETEGSISAVLVSGE